MTQTRIAEVLKQGKPATGPATEACDIPDNAYHAGGKEVRTGVQLMRGHDIALPERTAAAVLLLKPIK